ncbi:uncharacterized protein LOC122070038 [Macadamia integrifolia]|uniref:uncharacterized protein LOC122070038 n=1 Tax=Macadamia integrifolia TaxID=60698 RepID=UPI001C4E3919|nr:uncharacterized protein LOC122070038 [Macadamia integrifolia]
MSVAVPNLFTNSRSHLLFYPTNIRGHSLKTSAFAFSTISSRPNENPLHFQILGDRALHKKFEPFVTDRWRLRAFESGESLPSEGFNNLNLDAFLCVAEVFCLVPSAALSIGVAVNWAFSSSQKSFPLLLANRVLVWQLVLLVGAVAIGALIRSRQWKRICRDSFKSGTSSFSLIDRIEKLEEDIRSSATIIRVLSRQLEKLGIRFRVTRKTLKDPITEMAALTQKNSEATRALAAQEDILEKELGEIQKVLLAMQEQQQKQLELILAIGKAGKLKESKRETAVEEEPMEQFRPVLEGVKQVEIQTGVRHMGTNNDKP